MRLFAGRSSEQFFRLVQLPLCPLDPPLHLGRGEVMRWRPVDLAGRKAVVRRAIAGAAVADDDDSVANDTYSYAVCIRLSSDADKRSRA